MLYKQKIKAEIVKALNGITISEITSPSVERTKSKEHGDVATNIAMIIAKEHKRNPIEIANEIKSKIKANEELISHIAVAKPGFLNFVVGDYALTESIIEVIKTGNEFGFAKKNSKEKIIVEYVSANPTGDLHIGHGRQAVIGSCLVNLLEAAGHKVEGEFYINDYGEQIQNLSEAAWELSKKLKGEKYEWKEDFYPEETILPYVKKVIEKNKTISKDNLGTLVKNLILKEQEELLKSLRVTFNRWFSETDLHNKKETEKVLKSLKETNYTYEQDGAIWLKSKELGDSRDRVLIRSDGRATYLLPDIAYHIDKFKRSDYLITIWGADHHGQEISLKGGLKALGYDEKKLEIIFVQLVSLKKHGQEVKMSKRAGTVISCEEVLNEVGPDAFRYFLNESHPNNRMIFDIDLAKKQDKDNPVYYIQYAHARCCSIFRQFKEQNPEKKIENTDFSKNLDIFMKLFKTNNQEYSVTKELILRILDFPEEVLQASQNRSPSRIGNYLKDLACDFHQFYTVCRVISKDLDMTTARLGLVEATKFTLANGLKILGITALESM